MIPLATVILNQAPSIISALKEAFGKANPGAPVPTDDDILAELKAWAASTLAVDAAIKARLDGDTGIAPRHPTGSSGE